MRLQFQTVDVFTGTQFAGNPLAVVLNAEGLSTGQMQAIAAEFNLAETTFVRPPKHARTHRRGPDLHAASARCRLPVIPMSAPPSCWPAQASVTAGLSMATASSLRKKPGWSRLKSCRTARAVVGARLASPQPLSVGAEIAGELVALACGISPADIETANHRPCIASCGAPFILGRIEDPCRARRSKPRAAMCSGLKSRSIRRPAS